MALMILSADQRQPMDKLPWRPRSWEAKAQILRSWNAVVDLSLGQWTVGFGFDLASTGFWINLGPLIVGIEPPEPNGIDYDSLPDWTWTLCRIVVRRWKLELRVDLDLYCWQFGYAMADSHDHG